MLMHEYVYRFQEIMQPSDSSNKFFIESQSCKNDILKTNIFFKFSTALSFKYFLLSNLRIPCFPLTLLPYRVNFKYYHVMFIHTKNL